MKDNNPFADLIPENNTSVDDNPFADLVPKEESSIGDAFLTGIDDLQELAYRSVKGVVDAKEGVEDFIQESFTGEEAPERQSKDMVGQVGELAQAGIERNIEEKKAYKAPVESYEDIDGAGKFVDYAGHLIARSGPYMLASMTGVGAIGMGVGLSQEAYEAQPEDEKNALRAMVSGTGQIALERFGSKLAFGDIGKSIMKDGFIHTAKKMSKGDLAKIAKDPATALAFLKRVLYGAVGEGVTESAQESLAMWGAGKDLGEFKLLDHNENNDDFLGSDGRRLMESFVGGATVGGVIRGTTESAQKLISWQKKSAPIAKNGIDELVKQGVTQEEAIEQLRGQLITSAMEQGLTEAEAAAAAARTMKMEYDIDHEIFTPIANDVASRRAAMNERLNKQRIDGGIGDVQNALSGTTSPSADELVQQQMKANAPEFFEQLDNIDNNASTPIVDPFIEPEVNKVTKQEELLPDPRTEEQWNADQDQAQADWEATFDADKTPEEHKQAFEAKQKAEQPQKAKTQGLEVTEAPVNELLLSNDVPQFKDGANDKGVVEPLGGKFERTGVAPIQVWVRKDGKKEVISGRHRLDLAKRSGEQTIPAQYHYEEDGFNQAKAASLDAILNVREGQGKVKDYVEFIKDAGLSEKEADAQGILGRATGKRAYTIANLGSDSLIAAHRNDGITDEGATRIAKAAPNNEALQAVGIKAINDGKSITVAENLVKAVKSMTNDQQQSTGDLFGFDDSAMIEAENLAKAASKKQAEIQRSLSAIKGAAKNPALAAKEGVNVKNPKAVNERIEQLKENKRQWDNWHTNPKLVDELTGPIPPLPKQETPIKTASQEVVSVSEPKESDGAVIDNGTITQEPDLFTEKSIDEAAHEAATSPKNDLAEPTIAQAEANNYKLGRIEHSGMKIGIENPEGSNRTGIDPNGKEWSVKMTAHYGDLTGTIAADGDALDVFVKPSTTDSEKVFVVDQVNPGDGKFDEAKILMGFDSKEEAEAVYLSNYSKGWKGLGNITEVSKDDFKAWVKDGDTTKPFAANKSNSLDVEIGEISKDLSSKIQRQPGKIKLEDGNGKFGRVHIDKRHSKEINGLGYSVDEFVQEVTKNYNTVYKADNGELLLAKRNGKDYLMFVRLKPSKNGDFYSVSTAYPAEKRTLNNRLKKEKVSLLWESTEPLSNPISEDSAFAHRSDSKADPEEPSVTRHNKKTNTEALNNPYSNQGTAPQVPDGKPSKSSITPKPKADKIDDFGEVLHGANKHNYTFNEKLNDDIDLKAVPLSKSFPQPDYEKLLAEGVDPRALAFMAQLRGEIKPKPRQAGKVERWSHQVSKARHNARKLLEMGEGGSDIMISSLQKSEKGRGSYLKHLPLILDIAKEIPAKNIKALGNYKLEHSFYNLYRGEKNVHKWVVTDTQSKGGFGGMGNMTHFDTSEEAVAHIKSQVTDESIVNGKKLAKFDIWHERGNRDVVFLGKKVGTGKFIELKQFPTAKEARQYINENNEELVALLKDKKKIKAHRRKDNNPRIGLDHRKGKNVTPKMFNDAFSFRGIQFGNWVEGSKRQDDLNFAYDGLVDLAAVIGVPTQALSLNGELGLAFGARGKGGDNAAMAHYEPGNVVINLTKKMGAGSLAHEWWHALDNYFSRMDASKDGKVGKGYITEGSRQLGVFKDGKHQRATSEDFGVRQEVYDAFTSLTKAIKNETKLAERSAELDKLRGKDYWGTVIEMTARSFERYVIDKLASQGFESDYLANIVKESSTEASKEISDYPYPLAVEMDVVNKAYDGIFDILQTKETDQGIALFSRSVIPDSVAIGVSNTSTVSQADTDVVIESIINVEGSLLDKDHFVVVSTFNELPSDIKDAAKDQDAENGIGGVHYKGKTYLVRDKLADAQEVESTIFHETYGHYGIRKLFGKELPKKLNQLLQGIGGIAGLDKIAKKHNIDLLPYKKGLAQSSLTNAQAQTVLMDELLAHLAQDNKPSIKRMVKEVIGAIRQGLRKLGYKRLKEVTNSELFYVLKQARMAAHQAKDEGGSDIRFSQKQDSAFKPVALEAESYRSELSRAVKSLKSTVKPIKLGVTPRVLTALGAPSLDIYIRRDTVRKATNKAKPNHDIPMSAIERLPELLADPVAILNNKGGGNGKIVLVDALSESGKPIIVPIHLQVSEGKLIINRVASAYGVDSLGGKELLYVNKGKKKNPELSRLVHLLIMGSNRKSQDSDTSILTPDDIVNNSDIRFSRTGGFIDKITPKKQSDSLIANEDEGRINAKIRQFQDKFKPLKTVQEIISKTRKIAHDANAYIAEELFHGKVEEDLRKMERDYIQPLVDMLVKHDIDMAELDLYVIAKHAKERNIDVSKKNDAFDGESGSGMTNDEAQRILDKAVFEGKRLGLEEAASKIYEMTNAKRELLNESGLLSDSELAVWDSKFKYYVPLKGFANDEMDSNNQLIPRIGKGFAVKGKESIRALGRRTMASSPSTQVIQDLTESIIRHRKNEVGNAFLKLVESNPDKDYWEIFTENNPEVERKFNAQLGKVVETKIPMAMVADNYFTTKVDGETQYIKIKDDRLMMAMKNLGVDKVGSVVKVLGTINRYLSTINTSYNPEFMISNMARDIQTAVFNVQAEQGLPQGKIKGKNIAVDMVKDWVHARKGIALSLANKKVIRDDNGKPKGKSAEYQELFDQFREDGAKTGYFDMKDMDQQISEINTMLEISKNTNKGKLIRFTKKIGTLVENINQSVENAIRLSAYKQALDAFGNVNDKENRQKAASLAKNLTVNFNRKGEVGTTMNALYMFANASVQGSAQFLRSMQGYRDVNGKYKFTGAQKTAAIYATGAFTLAMINRSLSDDDDDGVSFWDKVPDHVKERNIVIMKSVFGFGKPGDYITIPLPYGYNAFSVFGTSAEAAIYGNKTVAESTGNIVGAMIGSFSPIGSQDSDNIFKGVAKTITPTIGQPIVQLAANENFTGNSIYRENFQFGTQKPNSALSKRSTNDTYKAVSSWLNEASGGSYYKSGVIDISPEVFKYFVDFGTGAAGSFAVRSATAVSKLAKGESFDDREIPFYRKVSGETNDNWKDQDKFYERENKIKQTLDEYKSLKGMDKVNFKKEHQGEISLFNHARVTGKKLTALRKRYKAIESNNSYTAEEKTKMLDMNRDQQDKWVDKFNLMYNDVNK